MPRWSGKEEIEKMVMNKNGDEKIAWDNYYAVSALTMASYPIIKITIQGKPLDNRPFRPEYTSSPRDPVVEVYIENHPHLKVGTCITLAEDRNPGRLWEIIELANKAEHRVYIDPKWDNNV